MRRFRIVAQAYSDIDAIAEFIARHNPERAESFVDEISNKIETIAERPLSFPERSEWNDGMRSALHGS